MSIEPHGGTLVDRRVSGADRDRLVEEAKSLPRIDLDERQIADLDMIAVGAMSPLTGFMGEKDYLRVVEEMRLDSGVIWPFPITLRVDAVEAGSIDKRVALYGEGKLLAVMDVSERFGGDVRVEAEKVYGTAEEAHPGVAALYAQGDLMLGGDVHVVDRPQDEHYAKYHNDPAELRAKVDKLGWKTVVGFQTRNPIHRAHEYLIKCALEIVDGALIHPLVGATKAGDIQADVRMRCYEALIDGYFPHDRVLLSVYPAAMRYAGPREAVFHALTRKNYGCTHFIVGRDHAGVGTYYGTYDAQQIFERFTPEELGITLFNFEHAFWCKKNGSMATNKTSDSSKEERMFLSGTQVRQMMLDGVDIPVEFTRPEVAALLRDSMKENVNS